MYSDNSKIVTCLDSFSKQIHNIWVFFRLLSVFETTALLSFANLQYFPLAFLPDLIGPLIRLL